MSSTIIYFIDVFGILQEGRSNDYLNLLTIVNSRMLIVDRHAIAMRRTSMLTGIA